MLVRLFRYSGYNFLVLVMVGFTCQSVCQVNNSFDPVHQKEISSQFEDYGAKLKIRQAACPSCITPGRFEIEVSRDHQILSSFVLPDELAQVDEILFASESSVLVVGHLTWAVNGIVVFNLPGKTIADYFWCYRPSLSPDKHFLVYEKFYPQHFIQGVSSEYLIYNLQKSAGANRPQGIKNKDLENVGLPIYPAGSRNSFGDNVELANSQVHTLRSDGFYWSNDSRTLAFADRFNGISNLVVVDVSSLGEPKIFTEPLPIDEIVNIKGARGICEGDPDSWFTITKIDFDNEDRSKLHLHFAAPSSRCLSLTQLGLTARMR